MPKKSTKNIKDTFLFKAISRLKFEVSNELSRLKFKETEYWEERYINGGNSGIGSYDKLAQYKAKVINSFIKNNNIETVIEFGCGDGNQLSLYELPNYVGFDISRQAIQTCQDKFQHDQTKTFKEYDGDSFDLGLQQADLILSIDVIFHVTNKKKLNMYLDALFSHSKKFVLIYSTNFNKRHKSIHQVDRKFSTYIEKNISAFSLIHVIHNPHKGQETMSDFYIYQRV